MTATLFTGVGAFGFEVAVFSVVGGVLVVDPDALLFGASDWSGVA